MDKHTIPSLDFRPQSLMVVDGLGRFLQEVQEESDRLIAGGNARISQLEEQADLRSTTQVEREAKLEHKICLLEIEVADVHALYETVRNENLMLHETDVSRKTLEAEYISAITVAQSENEYMRRELTEIGVKHSECAVELASQQTAHLDEQRKNNEVTHGLSSRILDLEVNLSRAQESQRQMQRERDDYAARYLVLERLINILASSNGIARIPSAAEETL